MSRGIYLETYIPLEYVRTRILLNVEFSIRDSRGAYSSTHVCIRLKNGQEIYIYINTLEDPIRLISNKNFSSEQFDTSSWMLEMHRKTHAVENRWPQQRPWWLLSQPRGDIVNRRGKIRMSADIRALPSRFFETSNRGGGGEGKFRTAVKLFTDEMKVRRRRKRKK